MLYFENSFVTIILDTGKLLLLMNECSFIKIL